VDQFVSSDMPLKAVRSVIMKHCICYLSSDSEIGNKHKTKYNYMIFFNVNSVYRVRSLNMLSVLFLKQSLHASVNHGSSLS